MREIDLNEPSAATPPAQTFLVYGDTKSGKTVFAGTFPRPLFLSDISEGGYESLREENWNDELTPLFEPDVRPIVWGISEQADMANALEKIKPLIAAGRVKTVAIDSITFYADLYLNIVMMAQKEPDNRQAYGKLGVHLRNIRISFHNLGVNVVWLALAKHPETDDKGVLKFKGRPAIPGEQSDKFMAGVNYTMFSQTSRPQPSGPARFEAHTREHMHYIAGNRLGKRASLLPSSLVSPTYSNVMNALGYDVDAIRNALPDLSKIPKISAPTAAPKIISAKTTTTVAAKATTPVITVPVAKPGPKITVIQK